MKINLPFIFLSRINNDKSIVLSVIVFTLVNIIVSSGAHLIYQGIILYLDSPYYQEDKVIYATFDSCFSVHVTDSSRYQYQPVLMVYIWYII